MVTIKEMTASVISGIAPTKCSSSREEKQEVVIMEGQSLKSQDVGGWTDGTLETSDPFTPLHVSHFKPTVNVFIKSMTTIVS